MNDAEPTPEEWVPFSGLALTSFILSLVLFIVAILGLWIIEIIPLAMAAYVLFTVRRGERRGRSLALWGGLIALSAGSCAYQIHASASQYFGGMGETLLESLARKTSAEDRDKELRPWAWEKALKENPDLLAQWRARYAQVVDAFGPWQETLDLPSILLGRTSLFLVPEGATEIGTGEKPLADWTRGGVVWIPGVFQRGTVYMAVIFHTGEAEAVRAVQEDFDQKRPGDPVPIVGNLRFFQVAPPRK